MSRQTVTIDSVQVELDGEKNLLEVVRKAGIELPTFCYHSEISVFGACRMCMVDVEGLGIVPACSTDAKDGMVVRTNTKTIRNMRKMIIELMLASHDDSCTTCSKSGACRLQSVATQLGVRDVRFKKMVNEDEMDLSSPALVRDPNKCVLCGDCVRVCDEIISVGALEFAYRGADSRVITCYNKDLGEVECVGCGQCLKACPVAALSIKTNLTEVWKCIYDEEKFVVVQIAPAVRLAIGECFGEKPGIDNTGKIVSALKMIGFDRVYDMCYAADFTVVEEGKEFLGRFEKGENLPIFTSCCPAWVKFVEQYYPELLNNLSTARSPMHMFGALCKDQLSRDLGIPREKIVVVCITPCTAKKFEISRPEFRVDGNPDVDFVIATDELGRLLKEHGIEFDKLPQGALDMPLSFATGGAVIFGTTGGVSEAVLRFAASTLEKDSDREFKQVRGSDGIKISEIDIGGHKLRSGVVSGLAHSRELIEKIKSGELKLDIIEVMACPGGCVNGGGQPVQYDHDVSRERAQGLYSSDRKLQFHASNENPLLQKAYSEVLDDHKAHELLHTSYQNRRPIEQDDLVLSPAVEEKKLDLTICLGRSCFLNGAQELYGQVMNFLRDSGFDKATEFTAKFCASKCTKGPVLFVNDEAIENCTLDKAAAAIKAAFALVT